MNQYPNSGSLFVRDKKNPKAADYGGDFSIDAEVLDYVLRKAERGEPVKLSLGGWSRQGRNNTRFISLKVELPFEERQQNNAPQRRPQPRQNGYGDQSRGYQQGGYQQNQPINTSRGQYQRGGQPQQRPDLDDDMPF